MATYENSLSDSWGMNDTTTLEAAVALSDALGISDIIAVEEIYQLVDSIGLSATLDHLITAYQNLSAGIGINEAIHILVDLVVSDSFGVQDTPTALRVYTASLVDGIILTGVASNRVDAFNVLSSLVGLLDAVERGLDAAVLDTIGINATVASNLRAISSLLDEIGIDDITSAVVGIYVTLDEGIEIDAALSSSAVLQNAIEDGFIISTTILGPGSDIYTGWVMNSENFAVTTYSNYKFTDMALLNGSYYGVKEDGIFLLEGDTDSGDNIGARIVTAAMEFGSSSLKTISQMYIGFRGDGDLVLKLISDEDQETWYQLNTIDTTLHTDRLTGAKGQVGRYWQLELVSNDSTKMELDTIELFPMVWGRKL